MSLLKELQKQGQSVWLDYIRRKLMASGELQQLVEHGLRGITSNPTIFEKAIAGSDDYDADLIGMLTKDPDTEAGILFERLAIQDIQMAADLLRPVYDASQGTDGFVSLEVSPKLARDTSGTIAEARRLWRALDRPNTMIKVPATPEGIPAIEALIAEGINVNVTLMFSLAHYEAVAQAYLRGLEKCSTPERISSVASFFISRVDSAVDKRLDEIGRPDALALRGKAAIANAKMVYRRFREIFYGEVFAPLRERGARVQRPLWASTGTKNPAYPDVLYVEELIGGDTVNTMPPATLNAFLGHGHVGPDSIQTDVTAAEATLSRLNDLGVNLENITEKLQADGVASFAASFNELLEALEEKRNLLLAGRGTRAEATLGEYHDRVEQRIQGWQQERFACRLWQKDPTLWFPQPAPEITDRLGWLTLPEDMQERVEHLSALAAAVKAEGIKHVVVLGMGGSSLAPEVFQQSFGNTQGYPELSVLNSTHPAAVRAVEEEIDIAQTLFLVSSKSGTTLETLSFFRYFWHRLARRSQSPGQHFIAITDPGTPLEELARERAFRAVFRAPADVGGRYSALTVFGLVPAALIGVDIQTLLDRAWRMAEATAFCVAPADNPGMRLGATLGELALAGRDKLTFLASPSLAWLPIWIEQLIAESTGKEGKGILPVADEPVRSASQYGRDRLFVHLQLDKEQDPHTKKIAELEQAGHPVVRLRLAEMADLGQEFFRWEVAVASAGAALKIHPFNQPDVQLAKNLAREAMGQKAKAGSPKGKPRKENGSVSVGKRKEFARAIEGFLDGARPGDYVALQAYLAPTLEATDALREIRRALGTRMTAATTLGYGPRFLHSTGQLHKGGPPTGLFLQLVDESGKDLPVPETDFSFGQLIRAQAAGDFKALKQRGRRVLRINLGRQELNGLRRLKFPAHFA